MSYSKLIHEYLDDGLDGSREEILFAELAKDTSLREEFNRQMQLHIITRNDMNTITPPSECTSGIFNQLGFSIPAESYLKKIASGTSSPDKPSNGKRLLEFCKRHFPTIAVVLLLITASSVISILTYRSVVESNIKDNTAKSSIALVDSKELAGNATQPAVSIDNSGENSGIDANASQNGNSKSNPSQNSVTGSHFPRNNSNTNTLHNSRFVLAPEAIADVDARTSKLPNVDEAIYKSTITGNTADDAFRRANNFLRNRSDSRNFSSGRQNWTPLSDRLLFNNPTGYDFIGTYFNTRYTVTVQGCGSDLLQTSQANSLPHPYDLVSNLSIVAYYKLDKYHAIGIEIGRQQFSQEFTNIKDGKSFIWNQNPSLLYYGAIYRLTLPEALIQYIIYPYGQLFVGTSTVGPMAKLQFGLNFSLFSSFVLSAGAEQSVMFYRVQDITYSSSKLGLIIGFNYNFNF